MQHKNNDCFLQNSTFRNQTYYDFKHCTSHAFEKKNSMNVEINPWERAGHTKWKLHLYIVNAKTTPWQGETSQPMIPQTFYLDFVWEIEILTFWSFDMLKVHQDDISICRNFNMPKCRPTFRPSSNLPKRFEAQFEPPTRSCSASRRWREGGDPMRWSWPSVMGDLKSLLQPTKGPLKWRLRKMTLSRFPKKRFPKHVAGELVSRKRLQETGNRSPDAVFRKTVSGKRFQGFKKAVSGNQFPETSVYRFQKTGDQKPVFGKRFPNPVLRNRIQKTFTGSWFPETNGSRCPNCFRNTWSS